MAVAHAWVGNQSATGFGVTVKATGAIRVKAGTNTGVTTGVVFSTSVTPSSGYATCQVTGLTPNTQYYYVVEEAGVLSTTTGRARTFPTAGTAANFTVAFSSCLETGNTLRTAFDRVVSLNPMFFAHRGDFHYGDNSSTSEATQRGLLDAQIQVNLGLKAMLAQTPTYYHQSDHDAGANDADPGPYTVPIQNATKMLTPQTSYPVAGTLAYAFTVGRVRMIFLDSRSPAKSLKAATDNSSKTMLGAAQKAWLKTELLRSEPLKIMFGDTVWIQTPDSGEDSWSSFNTERTELGNFIRTNNLVQNVLYCGGDSHSIMADSGVNNAWGGFAVMGGASLGQSASIKGGPWSQGATGGPGQFGHITVTDNGSTLTWAYAGYRSTGATAHTLSRSISTSTVTPPVDPEPVTPDPTTPTEPLPPAPAVGAVKNIFATEAEIQSLPVTGTAWDRVKAISTTDPGVGQLGAISSTHGPSLIVMALRWRRDGGGLGRQVVIDHALQALATYDDPIDQPLNPYRQIGAYVRALDLVDASMATPVPGTGLTLGALYDRLVTYDFLTATGVSGNARWANALETTRDSGSNWGSMARDMVAAIGLIRGNQVWIDLARKSHKRMLGDLTVHNQGTSGTSTNPRFTTQTSISAAWFPAGYSYPDTTGAINPAVADLDLAGANAVEASRGSAAPPLSASGLGYTMESWEGMVATSLLFLHAGYPDALTWGNNAIARNAANFNRYGGWTDNASTQAARRFLAHLCNYLFGTTYNAIPVVDAQAGRRMLPDVIPWLVQGSWSNTGSGGGTTPVVVPPTVSLTLALAAQERTIDAQATVTAGSSPALTARFDWGDGSASTVDSSPPFAALHTYSTAGPKTVSVTVTAQDGSTATTSATRTLPQPGVTTPTAAFTATTATRGRTPHTVRFTLAGTASGNATSVVADVDFGDGQGLVNAPLSGTFDHTYQASSFPASFIARVTVTQASTAEVVTRSVAITVDAPLEQASYLELFGYKEEGTVVPLRAPSTGLLRARGFTDAVALPQAEYDALPVKDPSTLYITF
jgi:hypothetical protein